MSNDIPTMPYSRDQHDPAPPPEDVNAFGYRRLTRDGGERP